MRNRCCLLCALPFLLLGNIPSLAQQKGASGFVEHFVVPQGTVEEKLAFLAELKAKRPNFETIEQATEHFRKVFATVVAATDKMLEASLDRATEAKVLTVRFEALEFLVELKDKRARRRRAPWRRN